MLLLLLRGEVLPPTLFKLVRVVKLRLQTSVISRETLGCSQKWTSKNSHASARPYEEVRQCSSPVFFQAGLCPQRIPPPKRPGTIRVKKRVPGYQQISTVAYPYCGGGHYILILSMGLSQCLETKTWNRSFIVNHLHGGFEVCQQLGP